MTSGSDALAEAMRLESARIYGRTLPDTCSPYVEPIPECGTGPAPKWVIAQLLEDLADTPITVRITERRLIEQAIARGLDDEQIVDELDAHPTQVRAIRDDMDRLAS